MILTNSASVLRIIAVAMEGNDIRLTWTCAGSHSYVLQSTIPCAPRLHWYVHRPQPSDWRRYRVDNQLLGRGSRVCPSVDITKRPNSPKQRHAVDGVRLGHRHARGCGCVGQCSSSRQCANAWHVWDQRGRDSVKLQRPQRECHHGGIHTLRHILLGRRWNRPSSSWSVQSKRSGVRGRRFYSFWSMVMVRSSASEQPEFLLRRRGYSQRTAVKSLSTSKM